MNAVWYQLLLCNTDINSAYKCASLYMILFSRVGHVDVHTKIQHTDFTMKINRIPRVFTSSTCCPSEATCCNCPSSACWELGLFKDTQHHLHSFNPYLSWIVSLIITHPEFIHHITICGPLRTTRTLLLPLLKMSLTRCSTDSTGVQGTEQPELLLRLGPLLRRDAVLQLLLRTVVWVSFGLISTLHAAAPLHANRPRTYFNYSIILSIQSDPFNWLLMFAVGPAGSLHVCSQWRQAVASAVQQQFHDTNWVCQFRAVCFQTHKPEWHAGSVAAGQAAVHKLLAIHDDDGNKNYFCLICAF